MKNFYYDYTKICFKKAQDKKVALLFILLSWSTYKILSLKQFLFFIRYIFKNIVIQVLNELLTQNKIIKNK